MTTIWLEVLFFHVILLTSFILVCTTGKVPVNISLLTYFTSKQQFPETNMTEILISNYKMV